jgi:hypothetical protein
MTRGSEQGKKIDEIQVGDWNSPKLIVRYHSSRFSPEFTVEVADRSFKGTNLKSLIEQGRIYASGWDRLKWDPIVTINTEIYSELSFEYSRAFKSRHKNADVFRHWKVGDHNEGTFGSRYRNEDEKKTADTLDGGEPGDVMRSRGRGRILPYTHDLWCQVRKLSQMLQEAHEKTSEKLTEMLKDKELPSILPTLTNLQPLGLQFKEKA